MYIYIYIYIYINNERKRKIVFLASSSSCRTNKFSKHLWYGSSIDCLFWYKGKVEGTYEKQRWQTLHVSVIMANTTCGCNNGKHYM